MRGCCAAGDPNVPSGTPNRGESAAAPQADRSARPPTHDSFQLRLHRSDRERAPCHGWVTLRWRVLLQSASMIMLRSMWLRHPPPKNMSSSALLLLILVLLLFVAFPVWPYSRGWGYGPSGVLGVLLLVLLVLAVTGNL